MTQKSVQAYIEEVPAWEGGTHLAGPPLSCMQWLVWSLATAGKFFEGLIVFMGGIALPLVAEQFNMTSTEKGFVTAATLFGILLGALFLGYPFLTSHTAHFTLPLLGEIYFASALFFDAGVFAAVVGSTLLILTALAHQSVRSHRKAPEKTVTATTGPREVD